MPGANGSWTHSLADWTNHMQRTEDNGVIISCDFCGTDWDEIKPMIEGHHGSVLCLECLGKALKHATTQDGEYRCTLCLREGLPASLPRWQDLDSQAVACMDCLHQAAKAFDRDPDVNWSWHRET